MFISFVLLYMLVLGKLSCLIGKVIRSAERTGDVGDGRRGDLLHDIPDTVPTEWIESFRA